MFHVLLCKVEEHVLLVCFHIYYAVNKTQLEPNSRMNTDKTAFIRAAQHILQYKLT